MRRHSPALVASTKSWPNLGAHGPTALPAFSHPATLVATGRGGQMPEGGLFANLIYNNKVGGRAISASRRRGSVALARPSGVSYPRGEKSLATDEDGV